MLKDNINDVLTVEFNEGINTQNSFFLNWYGLADGNLLTRNYTSQNIQNRFLRLIKMYLAFYTDSSNFEREVARDTADFATNSNTRYSMLRPYTRIPIDYFQNMAAANSGQFLKIFFDSVVYNLFENTYMSFFDSFDLNLIKTSKLSDGIDLSINASFLSNQETPTIVNPFVIVQMQIEKLDKLPDNINV